MGKNREIRIICHHHFGWVLDKNCLFCAPNWAYSTLNGLYVPISGWWNNNQHMIWQKSNNHIISGWLYKQLNMIKQNYIFAGEQLSCSWHTFGSFAPHCSFLTTKLTHYLCVWYIYMVVVWLYKYTYMYIYIWYNKYWYIYIYVINIYIYNVIYINGTI